MLKTVGEIKNDVIVKLGISTTSAYYTDAILNDWIKQSTRWALAQHKFPFTEGMTSTTYVSGQERYDFEGYKADSFRIIQLGGKGLEKLNYEDYLIFLEDEPQTTGREARVFSDFNRSLYVNPNTDLSGTLTAWGQYAPIDPDMTLPSAETAFTNWEEEGNEAIVEKVLEFANTREKKPQEAQLHLQNAVDILDKVWDKVQEEQFNYKTKNRGMFRQVDVLNGGYREDGINTNQF